MTTQRTRTGALGALSDLLADGALPGVPEAVTDAIAALDRAESLGSEAGRTVAATKEAAAVTAGARILHGADPAEAHTAAEADKAAYADALATHEATASAVISTKARARKAINVNRSAIIAAIREQIAPILAEADPLAAKLAGYGPRFDPDTILRAAKPAEVKAYQAIMELDARFQRLVALWLSLWKEGTSRTGGVNAIPPEWRPGFPGGIHAWERPFDVLDVDVRDGVDSRLIAVATWAAAGGYRLADAAEVGRIFATHVIEMSWPDNRPQPRRVYLAGEPLSPNERPRRKRVVLVGGAPVDPGA
jgi:hypothetical protein